MTPNTAPTRPPDPESTRNKFIAYKKEITQSLGSLVRYIGFGLAAATFALLVSSDAGAKDFISQYRLFILVSGGLGCLCILFDYLQHLVFWAEIETALNTNLKLDENHPDPIPDKQNWFFVLYVLSFARQVTCGLGSVMMIWILFDYALKEIMFGLQK